MSRLSDAQKRGLFSLLTGVDTGAMDGGGKPVEQIPPVGPRTTTVDSGGPNQNFLLGITQNQILSVTVGILALLAVFGFAKKVF